MFRCILPVLLLIAGTVSAESQECASTRRVVAVFAASNYHNVAGYPDVTDATADAAAIADLFVNTLGYKSEAFDSAIEPDARAFRTWLAKLSVDMAGAGAADLVLFVTGHGGRDGGFAPAPGPDMQVESVSASEILGAAFGMKVCHVLVILHYCYSGRVDVPRIDAGGSRDGTDPDRVREFVTTSRDVTLGPPRGADTPSPFVEAFAGAIRLSYRNFNGARILSAGNLIRNLPGFGKNDLDAQVVTPRARGEFTIDLDAMEDELYANATSAADLKTYLTNYPTGIHLREATFRLASGAEPVNLQYRLGPPGSARAANMNEPGADAIDREENKSQKIKPKALPEPYLSYVWIPTTGSLTVTDNQHRKIAAPFDEVRAREQKYSGFWMSETEIPVGSFLNVMHMAGKQKDREPPPYPAFNRKWSRHDFPMVNVPYQDARDYCNRVGGDLPTEDEWIYAAGSGDPPPGNIQNLGPDRVNVADKMCPQGTQQSRACPQYAAPVEEFAFDRNFWGLRGIYGNVSEIVQTGTAANAKKPGRSREADTMTALGASFRDIVHSTEYFGWENALRTRHTADIRGENTVGFRCVIRFAGASGL